MRRLMLLRHAKSGWPEGITDAERPLEERGRRSAPEIGKFLASQKLIPDLVLVSGAARTRQTWELIAPAFGQELDIRFEAALYGAGADAILEFARRTPQTILTLLIVGHNPGLENLARAFAQSGDADAIRRIKKKYPTTGLAVIELPIDDWTKAAPPAGRLEMFVTPKSLEL